MPRDGWGHSVKKSGVEFTKITLQVTTMLASAVGTGELIAHIKDSDTPQQVNSEL